MDEVTEIDHSLDAALARLLDVAPFASQGAVMTDLDGTAVHEHVGRIVIPKSVSHALTELRRLGRPIVLNSLRFPLNVIQTFGREWYAISNAPLPLVSLNGSVVGHLREGTSGAIEFDEVWTAPLPASTCQAVLGDLERLLVSGEDDIVLFYYPRDWRSGEHLWAPVADRCDALRTRYPSASGITSGSLESLSSSLPASEPCMPLVLIDASHDQLMAYQHVRPNQFVTASGIDKSVGAKSAAHLLGFELDASVGAPALPYAGRHATLDVADSLALGELWFRLADQVRRSMR
jgi:hypothetical protein